MHQEASTEFGVSRCYEIIALRKKTSILEIWYTASNKTKLSKSKSCFDEVGWIKLLNFCTEFKNFQKCFGMAFTDKGHPWWALDLFIVVNYETHGNLFQYRGIMEVSSKKVICCIDDVDWWTKTPFTFVEEDRNIVFVSCGQQFEC